MVSGGHITSVPLNITYSSVVSRETVGIVLTMAVLNEMSVNTADIMNAYIKAPCRETLYTTLGPKFGRDEEKMEIIDLSLCGLKSAGAYFWNHLAK